MIFELGSGRIASIGVKFRGRQTINTIVLHVDGSAIELRVSGLLRGLQTDLVQHLQRGARLTLTIDEEGGR